MATTKISQKMLSITQETMAFKKKKKKIGQNLTERLFFIHILHILELGND